MSKASKTRTRRIRRKNSAILRHGRSAAPKHTRIGGRTGRSMRKNGKSVRA